MALLNSINEYVFGSEFLNKPIHQEDCIVSMLIFDFKICHTDDLVVRHSSDYKTLDDGRNKAMRFAPR